MNIALLHVFMFIFFAQMYIVDLTGFDIAYTDEAWNGRGQTSIGLTCT